MVIACFKDMKFDIQLFEPKNENMRRHHIYLNAQYQIVQKVH